MRYVEARGKIAKASIETKLRKEGNSAIENFSFSVAWIHALTLSASFRNPDIGLGCFFFARPGAAICHECLSILVGSYTCQIYTREANSATIAHDCAQQRPEGLVQAAATSGRGLSSSLGLSVLSNCDKCLR